MFAGSTDLDLLLRMRGVERVIIAGMTAPGCVEGTARHAVELGYPVTLVTDATAAYSDELMYAAHHLSGPLFADHVLSTDDVIAAIVPTAIDAGQPGQVAGRVVSRVVPRLRATSG